MRVKRAIFILALFASVFQMVATAQTKILFDTDMGNDVDDVVALDMLYKYQDEGTVDIVGILSSKREIGSVKFIDVMNTIYGYPNIPIGIVKTYADESYKCADKKLNYADYVVQLCDYPHTITDYEALPDGYLLARKLLSEAEDKSITIVAVGFSTNMMRLLDSKGDKYSPLDGRELMRRKVARVVIMAGNFEQRRKEYNIYNDRVAATRFIMECPVEMLFTDFALGRTIYYPYTAVWEGFKYMEHHPLVEAFNYYFDMPYNRPLWDPTAVLFAAEPKGGYASLSPRGYVTVDYSSITDFTEDKASNRRYYILNDKQRMKIVRRVVELTMREPKNKRSL